jgi:uncharacterized protein (TIGR04255 family)
VWFINNSDDQLIQFQKDRFYFNWRKREQDYPRYSFVISQFEAAFLTIKSFFAEQRLGELEPIENELTYINHIVQGEGWSSPDNLKGVFTDLLWMDSQSRFLPPPQRISWSVEFALPANKGTLAVNLKHATRVTDRVNLLVLELIARGKPESTDFAKIREWFDVAHEWVVRGFTDLTTAEIQNVNWMREDA